MERCFACVSLPRLNFGQVDSLIPALKLSDESALQIRRRLQAVGANSVSLAEVYSKALELTSGLLVHDNGASLAQSV